MLKSYLITAIRSIRNNGLFSLINIVGLAVSMSVGLMIIAFISDLNSYDNFHENSERIYRVITTQKFSDRPSIDLASTSVKAGLRASEVAGLEGMTILRRGFGGEVKFGANFFELSGLWADKQFFEIFSFPLLRGNPATALVAPNSLVLTEEIAVKLFGNADPIGKSLDFDGVPYTVTGVMEDIPELSHLQFEVLASFSTVEALKPEEDYGFLHWRSIYSNYVYIQLPKSMPTANMQAHLDRISAEENAQIQEEELYLFLQPLEKIALSKSLRNPVGPTMMVGIMIALVVLVAIIIFSACFNYTNLSIAGSFKRFKEVGMRKIFGAGRKDFFMQFIVEAITISLIALFCAIFIFLVLRPRILSLAPEVSKLFTLELRPSVILSFVLLAIAVGLIAGFLPTLFFLRLTPLQTLGNVSSMKLSRRVSLRKFLIVIQFVFSVLFITITIFGFKQYRYFVSFDLGFRTENILNIRLQDNNPDVLKKRLLELPEVTNISKSVIISSLGSKMAVSMRYQEPNDSIDAYFNWIDEHYIPLHDHQLLAGINFSKANATTDSEEGVIVNEQVLQTLRLGSGNPTEAIDKLVLVDGAEARIIGVVKDFHHGTVGDRIEPYIFRYSDVPAYLNVGVKSDDIAATMTKINNVWKEVDNVHPLDAEFYDDQIEYVYSQFSMMIRILGFLAFLSIVIASMGLFGLVVFTMRTRMKEISIRKVFGASRGYLIFLLSREFLILLFIAALIALPAAYFFFDGVILSLFAYHAPIGFLELFLAIFLLALIALIVIGLQTNKTALQNPAEVLRNA